MREARVYLRYAALVLSLVFSITYRGLAQSTFSNREPIFDFTTGYGSTPGSPYPSEIFVSGVSGLVSKVTVTLHALTFYTPSEADILLVGPNGQSVVLMSDTGGFPPYGSIENVTVTFDDAALGPFASDLTLTYKPTNSAPTDDLFPYPAPAGPYGATLSVLNATNPNGTWTLYMVDDNDAPWDYGGEIIREGWSVTITTSTQINSIDNAQFFVRQHYLDFLNREPDPAGLAFWTNEILSCGTDQHCIDFKRINVSAAFFLSIEFQETGYWVYRMHKAAFGNLPGAPVPLMRQEFWADTQNISQGIIVGIPGWEQALENKKNAFAGEFVNRSRFTMAFPQAMSAEQYVDTLNANAGSVLSSVERDQLVSQLTSGARTRSQVLRAVAENSEFAGTEFNKAFVLMQYLGYLRRDPNSAPDSDFNGYNFWLNKLNSFGGNFVNAEMVNSFLISSEYRQRFD